MGYAPLSQLLDLAQADPTDNSREMAEILRRFDRLALKIARSMTSCPHAREDLANAARLGLVRAVRRHDRSRPGFGRFAERHMHFAALRAATKISDIKDIPVTDEMINSLIETAASSLSAPPISWGTGKIAVAISKLKPQQQLLLRRRYIEDALLQDLATAAGTSVSAVSQRLTIVHRAVARELIA